MNHQKRLHDELTQVKSNILVMLSKSSHPAHQGLITTLKNTANNEWLDLAAKKLGPEYANLINRMTMLEAAVSQIDIGQYGYCCDCEEKIATALLQKDPATQRCTTCEIKRTSN